MDEETHLPPEVDEFLDYLFEELIQGDLFNHAKESDGEA